MLLFYSVIARFLERVRLSIRDVVKCTVITGFIKSHFIILL